MSDNTIGHYIQSAYYGLTHRIPYYAIRPLPSLVEARSKARTGSPIHFQILIEGIGGKRWINVDKESIR